MFLSVFLRTACTGSPIFDVQAQSLQQKMWMYRTGYLTSEVKDYNPICTAIFRSDAYQQMSADRKAAAQLKGIQKIKDTEGD